MNQWLLIRRLRGPAFLLLVGITALLNQWDVLSFGRSWPLYLILAGLLKLAERAALAKADVEAYDPRSGQVRTADSTVYGSWGGGTSSGGASSGGPGSSIVPAASTSDSGIDAGTGRA